MEAVIIPIVNESNLDAAALAFNTIKPAGTHVSGVALVLGIVTSYWSVNYEVVSDQFPLPSAEDCVKAKARFQSAIAASTNGVVKDVEAIVVKPGGLFIRKWQVRYFTKLQAASEPAIQRPHRHHRGPKTLSQPDHRDKRSVKLNFVKSTSDDKNQSKPNANKMNQTSYQEQIFKTLQGKIKEAKLFRTKISNTFIDKSNVFKFKASDIKRWFSPRKANFSFGLRRVLHKQRKVNAERGPVTKLVMPQEKSTAQAIKESFNAVGPGAVYEDLRAKEIYRNVFVENKEKIKLISALFHIVNCKTLNHSPAHCGIATEYVVRYNLQGTKDQQKTALLNLQETYNLTDEVLKKIHLVSKHDVIEMDPKYLSPDAKLTSQLSRRGNFIGFAGIGFDSKYKSSLACH